MKVKSTLLVFNQADVKAETGVVGGQTIKTLIGNAARPSERILVGLASFKPGTHEKPHWHLIEAFYYVISGRAVMTDIEGKSYTLGPGSVIYAPAGIAGTHDWDIKEELQLLAVRGTTDREKIIQFDVDESTKESSIEFDTLVKWGGAKFKSLY